MIAASQGSADVRCLCSSQSIVSWQILVMIPMKHLGSVTEMFLYEVQTSKLILNDNTLPSLYTLHLLYLYLLIQII
jgi:hypothetical protein